MSVCVMGAVEIAEQEFTSSIAELEDACMGFLAVAIPEPYESAQKHLDAVHTALEDVLSMAVRLNSRVTDLRTH